MLLEEFADILEGCKRQSRRVALFVGYDGWMALNPISGKELGSDGMFTRARDRMKRALRGTWGANGEPESDDSADHWLQLASSENPGFTPSLWQKTLGDLCSFFSAALSPETLQARFALELLVQQGFVKTLFVCGKASQLVPQIIADGTASSSVACIHSPWNFPRGLSRLSNNHASLHVVDCVDWFLNMKPSYEDSTRADESGGVYHSALRTYLDDQECECFAWGWTDAHLPISDLRSGTVRSLSPRSDAIGRSNRYRVYLTESKPGKPIVDPTIWIELAERLIPDWRERDQAREAALGALPHGFPSGGSGQESPATSVGEQLVPKLVPCAPEALLGYGRELFEVVANEVDGVGGDFRWLWVTSDSQGLHDLLLEQLRIHLRQKNRDFVRHRVRSLRLYFVTARYPELLSLIEYRPDPSTFAEDVEWLLSQTKSQLPRAVILLEGYFQQEEQIDTLLSAQSGSHHRMHQTAAEWVHEKIRKAWIALHFDSPGVVEELLQKCLEEKFPEQYFQRVRILSRWAATLSEEEFLSHAREWIRLKSPAESETWQSDRPLSLLTSVLAQLLGRSKLPGAEGQVSDRLASYLSVAVKKAQLDPLWDVPASDRAQLVMNCVAQLVIEPDIQVSAKVEKTGEGGEEFDWEVKPTKS